MAIEVNGKSIEVNEKGFLVNLEDWNTEVGKELAKLENLDLTEQHWDMIHYLRDEYINNNANQPNTRTIVKDMSKKWTDTKVDTKYLYRLFPGDPSKQAGRIAGLPESRRKGGY